MSAESRSWRSGLLLFALVTVLSACMRAIDDRRLWESGSEPTEDASWFTSDPDSLYHVRRVARALEEGDVAPKDLALNHPFGSAIPWPPYYTQVLAIALGPFAPETGDAERRRFLEQSVASAPWVLGSLTSGVVAGLGYLLAGGPAGVFAGVYHALCDASLAYSKLGNGDHHAWIALLWVTVLGLLSAAAVGGGLERPRRCLSLGTLAGLLSGVALGSWVASLILIVLVDLTLGLYVLAHAQRARAGLGSLALGYHVAALVAVWPAVWASPWRLEEPFDVVNLSWFHASYLALGTLVVLPLPLCRSDTARRRYPIVVGSLLVALGVLLFTTDLAAGRALREGFVWAGKSNEFMSRVGESRSLFDADFVTGLNYVGYGALLLPLALGWAGFSIRRGRLEWLPFLVAGLVGAVQATRQMRFADVLAPTLALLVAGCLGAALRARAARWPQFATLGLAAVLALLGNLETVGRAIERFQGRPAPAGSLESPARLGVRDVCDWLRTEARGPGAVLASWRFGHVIEWAADRPSVATNFGLYVGVEGFEAPARFFMSEDPRAAERCLEEREARFVLVSSELPGELHAMIETAVPDSFDRYATFTGPRGGRIEEAWFRTFGARLLFGGEVLYGEAAPAIDFLRLVCRSAQRDSSGVGGAQPAAQVWERVAGARVVARGGPKEELRIRIRLRYRRSEPPIVWGASAPADASGRAEVRVPYATLGANGQGVVEEAVWTFGQRTGSLEIVEEAVRGGDTVDLN